MHALKFAAVAMLLPILAACSETTSDNRSGNPAPAAKSADATPITGNWCTSAGQTYAISAQRFDSADGQCAINRLNNYQGTFTAAMTCQVNGQPVNENVTITPIGQKLLVAFLSKGVKREEMSRCGG